MRYLTRHGSARVARVVLGGRLKVYAGAPHGLMYTHVELLTGDILLFIGSSAQ